MDDELLALLALKRIPGIGNFLLRQMLAYQGSAVALLNARKSALTSIPGIGTLIAESILQHREKAREAAQKEFEHVQKSGYGLQHCLQKEYPSRLKKIPDAPPVLYVKGNFQFENPRVIAVVGTRQATSYGKDAIEYFLNELSIYNPVVVSGLAYGIDIHAHKTALKLGLETWAVMGTGLNMIYPASHKSVASDIMERGGLITEVPDDAIPEPGRFPERNRIIAGLSDAVWVVEAMEKGGALITARLANDYFRDVFALPGNFAQATSAGCNQLISNHQAALVSSGKEIAQALGWETDISGSGKSASSLPSPENMGEKESQVWSIVREQDIHLDELSWRTGIGVNKLASILLEMEFSGFVKSLPGKKYSSRN
jgi:DNA processing protein